MKNLDTLKILNWLNIGALFITYESWVKSKLEQPVVELNKALEGTNVKMDAIQTTLEQQTPNFQCNAVTLEDFKILQHNYKAVTKQFEPRDTKPFVDNKIDSILDYVKEARIQNWKEFSDDTSTLMEKVYKYLQELSEKGNNIWQDKSITDLISEFKEFLSTLTTQDLCIVMNINLSILVFSCLISILLAFYGNYFITRFSLIEKYPKLSSLIKLRMKFQHFYIISNSAVIFIGLIFITYINIWTLMGW
jgi:hypothetical protein